MNEVETKVLQTSEYYINYYGQVIDIKPKKDLFILQKSGSGYGDQGYYCSFNTTYEVYELMDYCNGREMRLVGEIHEHSGTDGSGFNGTVLGQDIALQGVTADSVFKKIFKRK